MKAKVMEVITYKKQTSKTKYVIEATFEYKPQFFFREKKKPQLLFKKILIFIFQGFPCFLFFFFFFFFFCIFHHKVGLGFTLCVFSVFKTKKSLNFHKLLCL